MKISCSGCGEVLGELTGGYTGKIMYPEFWCTNCYPGLTNQAGQNGGDLNFEVTSVLLGKEGFDTTQPLSESQEHFDDPELMAYLRLAKLKKTQ